jgi:hypothetical protein
VWSGVNTDEDRARFTRTRHTVKAQLDAQHAVKLHHLHTAIASAVVQSEVNGTSLPGHRSDVYYRSDLLCVCVLTKQKLSVLFEAVS